MAFINGKNYNNVLLKMQSRSYTEGVTACDYDDGSGDPAPIFSQGSGDIIGFSEGDDELIDITIEMTIEAYEEFEAPAKLAGKSVKKYHPFPIVVSYWDNVEDGLFSKRESNRLHIDTIPYAKVVRVVKSNKRGDNPLMRTISLKGSEVV